MELDGKIIKKLSLQAGTGKNGEWKKQEYIIETKTQVPRKVCFSLWGEKVDQYKLTEGDEVIVAFDLESREYNERWYTEVKAWKISHMSGTNEKPIASHDVLIKEIPHDSNMPDDLPF